MAGLGVATHRGVLWCCIAVHFGGFDGNGILCQYGDTRLVCSKATENLEKSSMKSIEWLTGVIWMWSFQLLVSQRSRILNMTMQFLGTACKKVMVIRKCVHVTARTTLSTSLTFHAHLQTNHPLLNTRHRIQNH